MKRQPAPANPISALVVFALVVGWVLAVEGLPGSGQEGAGADRYASDEDATPAWEARGTRP